MSLKKSSGGALALIDAFFFTTIIGMASLLLTYNSSMQSEQMETKIDNMERFMTGDVLDALLKTTFNNASYSGANGEQVLFRNHVSTEMLLLHELQMMSDGLNVENFEDINSQIRQLASALAGSGYGFCLNCTLMSQGCLNSNFYIASDEPASACDIYSASRSREISPVSDAALDASDSSFATAYIELSLWRT